MLLLVDLDGVVWRGSEAVPGVPELLARRVRGGDDVVYVTNNSTTHRADFVPRLERHGAPAEPDRVVTAARASALYLRHVLPTGARVLVVGTPGLAREIAEAGLQPVAAEEVGARMEEQAIDGWLAAGRPEAVVVGLDREMSYLRIAAAADCVRAGALFVATHRDALHPTDRGLRPATGAMVAAIEAAASRPPAVSVGKPEPLLLQMAAEAVPGADLGSTVMIGDSPGDIAAGRSVGARTVLLLTGVTGRDEAQSLPPAQRPTLVAADAAALAAALEQLAAV